MIFYDAVRAEASGDLEKAIKIYKTLSAKSHSASLHANLANLFFKVEDYAKAVLHFRKAIWIDPGNRDYIANLSLALEMSGAFRLLNHFSLFAWKTYPNYAKAVLQFWIDPLIAFRLPQNLPRSSQIFSPANHFQFVCLEWVLTFTLFFRLPIISKKPFSGLRPYFLSDLLHQLDFLKSVEHTHHA